ncbi:MAG: HAMP domain-containing sensor histidine kinase [Desulfuromonas sp.]|nr:HAMP domain-containing sensor histidine kinase [Desulfuromonas sp.]
MRSFSKVFFILFVPIFLALLLTLYFSQRMIMSDARQELVQEMANMWYLIAPQSQAIEGLTAENYASMANLTKKTSLRITLLEGDGRVILDSLVPYEQITSMENHKNRPEVKQALYSAQGVASRFSHTKNIDMLYMARRLSDGRVLRLSYPATYVESLQRNFVNQALYSFAFLSGVILLLSLYFARKVSLPIQRLNYIADTLEAGKSNIHFPHFKDPSMAKIAGLIYRIYSSMQQKNVALDRDQQKLNHIFVNMNQGVLLLDNENCVLHVNPWLEKELGTKIALNCSLYNASNNVQLINFFNQLINNESSAFRLPLNDSIFDISRKVVDGQILLLLRNVTAQAEYESYKEQLTGNLSHELKTPLAMIMGYAETLSDNADIDEALRTKFVTNIYNASLRLNNLINDVLELSKLESVHEAFAVIEGVSLSEVANDIREFYAADDAMELNINCDSSVVMVRNEHLLSILTNLIDNARKYSTGSRIIVNMAKLDNTTQITVEDQGPQIDMADRDRIFERFYTCSTSRNKSHSGTGLGLSIIKHIAQLYAGAVWIENSDDGGNRFVVQLS